MSGQVRLIHQDQSPNRPWRITPTLEMCVRSAKTAETRQASMRVRAEREEVSRQIRPWRCVPCQSLAHHTQPPSGSVMHTSCEQRFASGLSFRHSSGPGRQEEGAGADAISEVYMLPIIGAPHTRDSLSIADRIYLIFCLNIYRSLSHSSCSRKSTTGSPGLESVQVHFCAWLLLFGRLLHAK